jgi:hypothetical protein
VRDAVASVAARDVDDVPRLVLDCAEDPLPALLRALSTLVLQHPIASQAVFSALVAEGRRFGATPQGRQWRDALANSELVRRGRMLWEGSVLNLLEDNPDAVIPSAIFDAILQAVMRPDLPAVLRDLLRPGR